MRERVVGKELCAIGDASERYGEVPILFVGDKEEIALSFGDFERFRPDRGLSLGLVGKITDIMHLIVEHRSAGRVANDESHRLDAVFKVGTGVDRAGHASNTNGSRHIHRLRCFRLFRADELLLASRGKAEEDSEARCESGAV